MKKRVTIKDVAREAGVSVATVSYVVNNRTDIQISDATRKKVLQITNLLGYTPNQAAQALATSRKRMLAFYFPEGSALLKQADQMYVLDFLAASLQEKNYGVIYLSESYSERYDQADAIICYDASSEYFHQVGDRNFVPLLALDCMLSPNEFFFQINSDYVRIAENARKTFSGDDYTLLLLDTPNLEKKQLLAVTFPSVSYITDLSDLSAYTGRNVLVLQQVLRRVLEPHMESTGLLYYQPMMTEAKVEALLQSIEYALDRISTVPHDVRVY